MLADYLRKNIIDCKSCLLCYRITQNEVSFVVDMKLYDYYDFAEINIDDDPDCQESVFEKTISLGIFASFIDFSFGRNINKFFRFCALKIFGLKITNLKIAIIRRC